MSELANTLSPEEIAEEQKMVQSVIDTFNRYRKVELLEVDRKEVYLNSLPDHHQAMLTDYRVQLLRKRNCIEANHKLIKKLIADADSIFDEGGDSPDSTGDKNGYHRSHKQLKTSDQSSSHPAKLDISRVRVTLKQIVRDWTLEGTKEREACYAPILNALIEHFPNEKERAELKILVPGAGLGRLTYEIAQRGFFCEGNEFSYFMLIGANFILNKSTMANQHTIYPYVHQTVNNFFSADPLREVKFPDVSAIENPPKGTMNMVAGDFLQVYREPEHWDCVATSFFIDCANNVIDFIENIFNILKKGGLWINLGPLLYHYSDSKTENSIEPSFEELVEIIKTVGFEIVTNETNLQTRYTQNLRSMYQCTYNSVFLVCRKN